MSEEEVEAFLRERHTMNIATLNHNGSIHVVAMWYALLDGAVVFETFAKSQKVANLRRDTRITALVEDGDSYDALRGVELVGTAEIITDHELLMTIAREVIARYQPEVPAGDLEAVAQMMVQKRVAIRLHVERVVSWDHRKLAGHY
jgi:PPOX class probable F420-dependent enzyme